MALTGTISFPTCSDGWKWSYNSLGQNPCEVAALYASQCYAGNYPIDPLQSNQSYYHGPVKDNNNACQCNTVLFSLMSGCGACQGSTWITWSQWSFNCSVIYLPGYPTLIQNETHVPHWAYLDVMTGDIWNATAAENDGGSPEVSPTSVSQGSSVTTSTVSRSPFSSPSSNRDKVHAGQVVGVVVGVIAAAMLITAIFWCFRRRRRRAEEQPSPIVKLETHMAELEAADQLDPDPAMPTRYYDPSDPSTFPQPLVLPTIPAAQTTPSGENGPGTKSTGINDKTGYGGLPLV